MRIGHILHFERMWCKIVHCNKSILKLKNIIIICINPFLKDNSALEVTKGLRNQTECVRHSVLPLEELDRLAVLEHFFQETLHEMCFILLICAYETCVNIWSTSPSAIHDLWFWDQFFIYSLLHCSATAHGHAVIFYILSKSLFTILWLFDICVAGSFIM